MVAIGLLKKGVLSLSSLSLSAWDLPLTIFPTLPFVTFWYFLSRTSFVAHTAEPPFPWSLLFYLVTKHDSDQQTFCFLFATAIKQSTCWMTRAERPVFSKWSRVTKIFQYYPYCPSDGRYRVHFASWKRPYWRRHLNLFAIANAPSCCLQTFTANSRSVEQMEQTFNQAFAVFAVGFTGLNRAQFLGAACSLITRGISWKYYLGFGINYGLVLIWMSNLTNSHNWVAKNIYWLRHKPRHATFLFIAIMIEPNAIIPGPLTFYFPAINKSTWVTDDVTSSTGGSHNRACALLFVDRISFQNGDGL